MMDLSVVLPYSSGVAEMLYTSHLVSGWCGLYRRSARQGIVLRFDTKCLPSLGIWPCYGGWPEGGIEPLQYAVTLEPTTAPFGTLLEAQSRRMAKELAPGAAFDWTVRFPIPQSTDSASFRRRHCSDHSATLQKITATILLALFPYAAA